MNTLLLKKDVQQFIENSMDKSVTDIALKKSPFEGISSSELANQVEGKKRCLLKIPLWAKTAGIYYPEKLNLEQCSSDVTAEFKSQLIQKKGTLLDLTAGFGVDSYYFSKVAQKVVSCEINEELSQISAYNNTVLGAENIKSIPTSGLDYLRADATRQFDYIFTDPSRRVSQQKVWKLSDCEPNIVAENDFLMSRSPVLIHKTAPLLDIQMGLQELPNVKTVHIISVNNDCKELLFTQEKNHEDSPLLICIRFFKGVQQTFSFRMEDEKQLNPSAGPVGKYLYEPDVAITKAGAFKSIGHAFQLTKLHQHTHLYSSEHIHTDFLGKVFEIEEIIPFQLFKKSKKEIQANIVAKNFPLKTDDLRKKFKIKDGGRDHLFFTTNYQNELIVVRAKKVF